MGISSMMHGAELTKQGALADAASSCFGGKASKSAKRSLIGDICESARTTAERLASGTCTDGATGVERDPESVETSLSGCAQIRCSYFLRQLSIRSSLDAFTVGRAPAEPPPNWALTTALPLSCMRLIVRAPEIRA